MFGFWKHQCVKKIEQCRQERSKFNTAAFSKRDGSRLKRARATMTGLITRMSALGCAERWMDRRMDGGCDTAICGSIREAQDTEAQCAQECRQPEMNHR